MRNTEDRARTAEEVFQDHLEKRMQNALEEDLLSNYGEDVVLLTRTGIYRGHQGVRENHEILTRYLPGAQFEYTNKLVEGEFAMLEWRGRTDGAMVEDGVDAFVIRDGRIVAQMIHYSVNPIGDE